MPSPMLARPHHLADILGCSRSTTYRMRSQPDFPRLVTLSEGVTGYLIADIAAYLEARKAPLAEA